MFRTIAEYILTFGRVPRQPRIISRSGVPRHLHQFLELWWRLILMKVGVALAVYEGSDATGVPGVLEVEHGLTLVVHIP